MKKHTLKQLFFLFAIVIGFSAKAQQPDPPGQVKGNEKPKNEAYLFAHMTHNDYGKLYYSVSLDGLHWENLNSGKICAIIGLSIGSVIFLILLMYILFAASIVLSVLPFAN